MRRTLPSWALLALLAGPVACASSKAGRYAEAGDAASAPMPAYAPQAAATGMPVPGGDVFDASSREEASYDFDASVASVELAKAAPAPAPTPPPAPAPAPAPAPKVTQAALASAAPPGPVAQTAAPKPAPPGPAPQPATTPAAPAAQGTPGAQQGAASTSEAPAPLLIYTAQIAMAVFEVGASLGKVEALARELGGFLARRDDRTITIRVPAARFDEALKRLEGLGDMLQRNVVAEDVTEEFLDLGVRIRNARAVRDRLEKLLEKAAKVEESIQLERELARVAGELERLEGRLKFLRDRVAFSTLTISFQPRSTETITPSGPRLPIEWLNELGLSRLLNL
ncbi:DUF4349 domain-containing protein [Sorangium sp. So ce136]|uniref:DUF4349 domain-containing protein n=1 Tax=Sorangium sp. So ce136 TaxID=3133284 RepID=UPI003F054D51